MSAHATSVSTSFGATRRAPRTMSCGVAFYLTLGVVIGLAPPWIGARLEARVFPVLTNQSIPANSITRTGRWLCWSWTRDKQRSPAVLGMDVTLDTANAGRSQPEIINAVTGVPWHTGGAVQPGHYETPFCLILPEFVAEKEPVRVRQVAKYRGFLGLWSLEVPLPEITA